MSIKRINQSHFIELLCLGRPSSYRVNNKEGVKGKVNEEYKVWSGGSEKNGTGGGGRRDLLCIKKSASYTQ